MRYTVKLPRLGDTVEGVVILSWEAEVGQQVNEGDVLVTVETDKVESQVPSPVTGTLVEQLVAVQDELPTGGDLAVIETA